MSKLLVSYMTMVNQIKLQESKNLNLRIWLESTRLVVGINGMVCVELSQQEFLSNFYMTL